MLQDEQAQQQRPVAPEGLAGGGASPARTGPSHASLKRLIVTNSALVEKKLDTHETNAR